jgi:UDP-glucuronate decarboxylase
MNHKDSYTLVAGGAGFLGSHLCKKLLSQGNKVICLDNLYTGDKSNLSEIIDLDEFIFLNQDIVDEININLPINGIYNLACPASPVHYQKDPIYTLRVCFEGALNLLKLANNLSVPIFQASTSEIYGDPLQHPQKIDYWGNVNPIGIRSCYDEGKRVAETLFFDYQRVFDTDIRVGRIFNTYGPNMDIDDGRVVSNFIVQALEGKPITIYGDGGQSRSFCYVDDLIEAFILMMSNGKKLSGPYNLGNPKEFTVKDLAEKVIEMTDSSSEIVYLDLPSDDPTRRKPDILNTEKDLSWNPKVELEEGLELTIKYFRNII